MARSGSPPLEDQRAHVFKNDSGIALPSRLGRVLADDARKVPVGLDVRIEGLARTAGPFAQSGEAVIVRGKIAEVDSPDLRRQSAWRCGRPP
jgi:hypothetical protein